MTINVNHFGKLLATSIAASFLPCARETIGVRRCGTFLDELNSSEMRAVYVL